MKTVIPDRDTAERVGLMALRPLGPAESFAVFEYEHKPSRLTMFGVELTLRDGSAHQVIYQ